MSSNPFPLIKHSGDYLNVKIFNNRTMKYLCLTEKGFVASIDNDNQKKANFELHFFDNLDKDNNETQLVLPINVGSSCLVMTDDKNLDSAEPVGSKITMLKYADSRFFYFKNPRTLNNKVAFEGMNGKDSNYYLAVDDNEERLVLKEKKTDFFPENMLFELQIQGEHENEV